MKVKNISKHNFCHSTLDENYKLQLLVLKPNEIKVIPDEVAQSWIKSGRVIEYIEPQDVKQLEQGAKKLEEENESLRQEIKQILSEKAKPKKQTKNTKKSKS